MHHVPILEIFRKPTFFQNSESENFWSQTKELQQPLQDLRFIEEEDIIEEDIVVFDTVVLVET